MRMLSHDVLTVARRILRDVVAADALARQGHEAQSRAMLSRLASLATAELPVIDAVLSAQTKAAENLDRAQWHPGFRTALRDRAEPHLNLADPVPANDPHATTPEQPQPAPIGTGL